MSTIRDTRGRFTSAAPAQDVAHRTTVPRTTDTHDGGTHAIYRFPNGYGASHLTGSHAYGGSEVAVIRYHGEASDAYRLVYDTPVTGDVIPGVTPDELPAILDAIAAL